MNKRGVLATMALLAVLASASGCQAKKVEVQSGTRTVDSRGNLVAENIQTLQVPPETAIGYHVTTRELPPSDLEVVATLYARAQKSIASGETSSALKALGELLSVVPEYREAVGQRDAIRAGKPVAADPDWLQAGRSASGLLRWMPDVNGFAGGKAVTTPLTGMREYAPTGSGYARMMAIVAEQYSTPGEAARALEVLVKRRYPKSATTFAVKGHDAYFGTDSYNLGVLAFTSGSVVVVLEATPALGSPVGVQMILASVAKQLP